MATLDPSGQPVPIVMGLTRNTANRWTAAMAIGDEATVVLTRPLVDDKLLPNMRAAIDRDRQPRVVFARDTLGRAVPIETRHVPDRRRRLVPVMRIGGVAAAAVLDDKVYRDVETNMRAVLADADQLNRGDA